MRRKHSSEVKKKVQYLSKCTSLHCTIAKSSGVGVSVTICKFTVCEYTARVLRCVCGLLGQTWKVKRSISVQKKSYSGHGFPPTSWRKLQSVYIHYARMVRSKVPEGLFTPTNQNGSRIDVEARPDKYGLLSMPHREGLNFSALSFPAHEITDEETEIRT